MGTSLWMAETAGGELGLPPLAEDLEVDACVIGAGFTGLTAALELARAGRRVCVLEAHQVGSGVSGHTTAKVSSLHGTVYDELRRRFGDAGATTYAAANEEALQYIEGTAGELGIDCRLRRRSAVTYVRDPRQRDTIVREAEAAQAAGLPARLTGEVDLPYPVAAAVELPAQLELQPRSYLLGLARELLRLGGRVFEGTMATNVGDGSDPDVRTASGHRVRARDVVVATHYPFPDRGLFFMRLTPQRSYCVAVRPGDWRPQTMSISSDQPTRSVRAHPDGDGGEVLIVGGEGHKAGEDGDVAAERYAVLEAFARDQLGAGETTHRWSAHDMTTADGVPYVGPLTPVSRHVWVGTGYRKWGLSNGTAAGRILADRILGRETPHAWLFDTRRFTPLRSAPGVAKEGAKDAKHFVGDRMRRVPDGRPEELAPGEGRLLKVDGEVVAASRDEDGTVHAVSAVCTHLGCRVAWNTAERSWDCPCHGSRFAPDGAVLQGPAVRPLAPAGTSELAEVTRTAIGR